MQLNWVPAVILGAIALGVFMGLHDYVMTGVFVAFGVISLIMGGTAKTLGIMAGLGGILAGVAFIFFGFSVPFASLFTIIAVTVAGFVTWFLLKDKV
jgi:hypothetical protein